MRGITKRKSIYIFSIAATWIIAFFFASVCSIRADSVEPLPPPVNIEFTTESTPAVNTETIFKLKVTPQEAMHADISCLLPGGIEPVRDEGIMALPYEDSYPFPNTESQPIYTQKISLWVGPLEAGITKEFTLRAIIPDKNRYELIARVEALAKWGIKDEILVIDIK